MFEVAADSSIAVMEPILAPGALALLAMLGFLVLQRIVEEARFRRRRHLLAHVRTLVDAQPQADGLDEPVRTFARSPAGRRVIITSTGRAPLARSTDPAVDRLERGAGGVFRHLEGRQDGSRIEKERTREGA